MSRLLASDRGRLAALLAVAVRRHRGACDCHHRARVAVRRRRPRGRRNHSIVIVDDGLGLWFQVLVDPADAGAVPADDGRVESLFLLWLLVLPLAGFAAWQIAGRMVGPVDAAIAAAEAAGSGNLAVRVPMPTNRGAPAPLAAAVNRLIERFERREADRRRLVDDAAHEIRNPLAVMQTSLDVALAEPADPEGLRSAAAISQRAAQRIARAIDGLQEEFRDHAPRAGRSVVDLADLAREMGRDYSAVAARRGVALHVVASDGITVVADRDALRRAFDNLVANALRFAPAGSPIVVGAGGTPAWRWFGVRDFGPGLPGPISRLCSRVAGMGVDRKMAASSGIGLALVRQIAEAHGGTVSLSSVPRGGSSFVIWLPAGDGRPAAPGSPDLAVDPLWFPPALLRWPTPGVEAVGRERPTSPPMPGPAQA